MSQGNEPDETAYKIYLINHVSAETLTIGRMIHPVLVRKLYLSFQFLCLSFVFPNPIVDDRLLLKVQRQIIHSFAGQ